MSVRRMIILAAGCGTRLGPEAAARPKALVAVGGRSMLETQLATAWACGIDEVIVVAGHGAAEVARCGDARVTVVVNEAYARTNMVASLETVEARWGEGFVVSYGDIVYEPACLRALLDDDAGVTVAYDRAWRSYWELRFDDPLDDAETFRLDGAGLITEIGARPDALDAVQGQYIGLVAFRGTGVTALAAMLAESRAAAPRRVIAEARDHDQLFLTDVLQGLIERGHDVRGVPLDGGWLEVDRPIDLEIARRSLSLDGAGLARIER